MGFITIESVITEDKKFTMEIESAGLHAINCCLSRNLQFLDNVIKICISDDILLVLTEDRDFRDGALNAPFIKDNREVNNIDAYDWQGNHLWNIGDWVGDIKMSFDGFTHISAKAAKKNYGVNCFASKNLYACLSGGFVFIIDSKKQKMLYKIAGKVR